MKEQYPIEQAGRAGIKYPLFWQNGRTAVRSLMFLFILSLFSEEGFSLALAEHENRPIAAGAIEEVNITGTVTDENGEPIPGVTVSVPGTGIGTATDLDGRYS